MIEKFTINKEKHIENIIEHFDFNSVHTTMKHLKWLWYTSSDTPSISELKSTAVNLLNKVYDTDCGNSISSGGFKASKFEDYLELEFVIEESSSEILNYGIEYERLKKRKIINKKITEIQKIII